MTEITALSFGKFVATESGLAVNGKPTFSEWMEYGKMLQRVNRALQMVIGDWLNEGEKRYGETYAQATALWPDMQQDTLRNWKWVAGAVKKSLRKDILHYSHYVAVAPLPQHEQERWLNLATADNLTSNDLRSRIRESIPPNSDCQDFDLSAELDGIMSRLVMLSQRPECNGARPHLEAAIEALRQARESNR